MSGETIRFVDTTLRDGNQSLWGATGITTPMVLAIAPTLDRVGFAALDFSSSTHMAISVRYHKENPFERIRQTRRLMPRTPLSFITTGMRFISWDRAPESLMRLSFRLVIRAGIRRVQIAEPMNDAAAALRLARMVREEGAEEIVPALAYTISPVHSDRFYVEHARALAASPDVDAVYLKDPGGLLTPERISALVPAIQRELGGKRLELHSHCNTGLAPVCYVDAARLGVHWLHTAVGPLANDTSQPSAENIVRNLRALGLGADLDLDAMERVAIHFRQIAHRHRLPLGAPMEYDVAYYKHQVPGGMMTTLKRQLAEIHQLERLPQVLEEVAEIRRELGFPIMVTPFSQFAGAQAVLNVASGKGRYDMVTDELIKYVLGYYGTPPSEIDPNVRDRVLSLPRAREFELRREEPSLETLRARIGRTCSDEELLLRLVMPEAQVQAMIDAPPAPTPYGAGELPLKSLIEELSKRRDIHYFSVKKPGFRLELARTQGPKTGP